MNGKRLVLSVTVTVVATLIVDILLNAIVFRQVYADAGSLLLPPEELNARVPLGWGALVVMIAAFGILFVRSGRTGVRWGVEFGALLALASAAGVAGIGSVFPWPPRLVFVMGVQQVVNGLLMGLLFGWLYRPRKR